jgi:hypothetical protein
VESVYHGLAVAVLSLHLLFILGVAGGALVTRGRPLLRRLHIASLVYTVLIQVLPWPPCPLTLLENWLEMRAGITPYQGPFLLHFLDATVYPNVPLVWLVPAVVAVCGLNLALYAVRYRRRSGPAW